MLEFLKKQTFYFSLLFVGKHIKNIIQKTVKITMMTFVIYTFNICRMMHENDAQQKQ